MPAYLVKASDDAPGRSGSAGVNSVVVSANSEADARAVAKSRQTGVPAAAWDGAEVTELTPAAGAHGFTLHVAITPPGESDTLVSVSIAGSADDSLDDLLSKAAKALNDSEHVNGAAYSARDRVLTCASAVGGDQLGDHTLYVQLMPPGVTSRGATGLPDAVHGVVHQGKKEAALVVIFADASYALPKLYSIAHSD